MQRYVIRRLLAVIPTLFFASIIVFLVIRILPGDAVDLIIKNSPFMENSDEMRRSIERDLGLDRPMHIQYVHWLCRRGGGDTIDGGSWGIINKFRTTPVNAVVSAFYAPNFPTGVYPENRDLSSQ